MFDELFVHLIRYNAPKIITIGEDATRLIARVDYDSETITDQLDLCSH